MQRRLTTRQRLPPPSPSFPSAVAISHSWTLVSSFIRTTTIYHPKQHLPYKPHLLFETHKYQLCLDTPRFENPGSTRQLRSPSWTSISMTSTGQTAQTSSRPSCRQTCRPNRESTGLSLPPPTKNTRSEEPASGNALIAVRLYLIDKERKFLERKAQTRQFCSLTPEHATDHVGSAKRPALRKRDMNRWLQADWADKNDATCQTFVRSPAPDAGLI